jgi:hypothetical protein
MSRESLFSIPENEGALSSSSASTYSPSPAMSVGNPNFPTKSGPSKPSLNRYGDGQNVGHGSMNDPLLTKCLGADSTVVQTDLGMQPRVDGPQMISGLTDSNSIYHNPRIRSDNSESYEMIQRTSRQEPLKPAVASFSSSRESYVANNTQVPPALSSSFGFEDDRGDVTWRDLQSEYDSNYLTDTKTLMEPFQVENGEPESSCAPPPQHALTGSLIDSKGVIRQTTSSGGDRGPLVKTHNLVPRSMIEKHVRVENVDELPRLVHRDRAFHQSSNRVFVKHNQGTRIFKLLRFNWFHVFLRWPTKWSLLTLLSIWTILILLFAVTYTAYDNIQPKQTCGLGAEGSPITFAGAFAFSLETCTTVGYTLPFSVNSFFEPECGGLQVIIYFQMIWSMIFNAFLLAFLYNRIGRSENRSTQVIYSNKALVSIVDGQVRFQVRLFDCDARHPVVEAHVRLYCVMKQRPVPRPMRLLQPNDELGGTLFLSFPTVVCHNIDLYSLLHPPEATMLVKPHGLGLRQVDGVTANRDDVVCPVCGESFGTFERWWNHVRFQQIVETKDNFPVEGTHRSLDISDLQKLPGIKPTKDLAQLREYFKGNVSEILCLVEGIDPMQSGTFQALQSYRYEDIVWDANSQFSPCLSLERTRNSRTKSNKIFSVDLDRYHDIIPDLGAATATGSSTEIGATTREALGMVQPSTQTVRVHPHKVAMSTRFFDGLFTPEMNHNSRRNDNKTEVLAKGGIETV